jgi:hypothetical protein
VITNDYLYNPTVFTMASQYWFRVSTSWSTPTVTTDYTLVVLEQVDNKHYVYNLDLVFGLIAQMLDLGFQLEASYKWNGCNVFSPLAANRRARCTVSLPESACTDPAVGYAGLVQPLSRTIATAT